MSHWMRSIKRTCSREGPTAACSLHGGQQAVGASGRWACKRAVCCTEQTQRQPSPPCTDRRAWPVSRNMTRQGPVHVDYLPGACRGVLLQLQGTCCPCTMHTAAPVPAKRALRSLEGYPKHMSPPQCSAGQVSAHLALTEGHSSSFCRVSSSSGMLEASQ